MKKLLLMIALSVCLVSGVNGEPSSETGGGAGFLRSGLDATEAFLESGYLKVSDFAGSVNKRCNDAGWCAGAKDKIGSTYTTVKDTCTNQYPSICGTVAGIVVAVWALRKAFSGKQQNHGLDGVSAMSRDCLLRSLLELQN
jgi:hypothetical protein